MSDIITRKYGDPFATRSNARGALTRLGLQETHEVISLGGGYALARINRDEEQVTLKPGDYVSTEGMDEEQYHAVAEAFMAAGAGEGEYPEWHDYAKGGYLHGFGWDLGGDLYHGDYKEGEGYWSDNASRCRHLTIPQVLNATNTTMQPKETTMTTDPITALKQARATRDEAEQAYQHALAEVREYLGEGFMLAEVGVDWAAPDKDMTDPANWREGDVIECVKEWTSGTKGELYTVMPFDRPGARRFDEDVMAIQVDDDDGDESTVAHHYFRFHHRPN